MTTNINEHDYIKYDDKKYYEVTAKSVISPVSGSGSGNTQYSIILSVLHHTTSSALDEGKKLWIRKVKSIDGENIECLINSKIDVNDFATRNVKKITNYDANDDGTTITLTYENIDPLKEKTKEQLKIESKFRKKVTPKLNALATMSPKIISTCLKINQESLIKNYELFMVYEKFVKNAKIFLRLIQSYKKIVYEYSEELGNAISFFDDPKLSMYVKENKKMIKDFNKEVASLIDRGVEFSDDIQKDIHNYLPQFDLRFAKEEDHLKILETTEGDIDRFQHKTHLKDATYLKRKSLTSFEIDVNDDQESITLTLKETDDKNIFLDNESKKKYKIFNMDAIGRYHQLQEFGTDLTSIFQHDLKTNEAFKRYVTQDEYKKIDDEQDYFGETSVVSTTKEILNEHFEDLLTEDDHHFAPIIKLRCGDVYYPTKKVSGPDPSSDTVKYHYEVTHVDKLDL